MNHYATPPRHELGDAARLQRITEEFRAGYDLLETLGKAITYFGGHTTPENNPEYEQARALAFAMAKRGITTVTGGGPGIMEAANRGAVEAGGRSVGFRLILEEEQRNMFVKESVSFYYLFVRKVMLASAGHAYVFFPGGFGSLDEFFEISTLIHTHKLHEDIPTLLFGRAYWEPMITWLRTVVVHRYDAFSESDLDMWTIVDTVEEACAFLEKNTFSVRFYY